MGRSPLYKGAQNGMDLDASEGRTFTGLCPQMWEGATVPIPTAALRSTDGDSEPEDLVYTIEQPSNGRVVLQGALGTEVHRFTQAQLNDRLVLFSHRGGC